MWLPEGGTQLAGCVVLQHGVPLDRVVGAYDRWLQRARRPIFLLRSADGAIGAHQQAVQNAYGHFADLARRILGAVGLGDLFAP